MKNREASAHVLSTTTAATAAPFILSESVRVELTEQNGDPWHPKYDHAIVTIDLPAGAYAPSSWVEERDGGYRIHITIDGRDEIETVIAALHALLERRLA